MERGSIAEGKKASLTVGWLRNKQDREVDGGCRKKGRGKQTPTQASARLRLHSLGVNIRRTGSEESGVYAHEHGPDCSGRDIGGP